MYKQWKKEKDSEKIHSTRKYWVHPILTRRETHGEFHVLFAELRNYDDEFYKYLRMTKRTFDKLLGVLNKKLEHQDTIMRDSISSAERLVITLR